MDLVASIGSRAGIFAVGHTRGTAAPSRAAHAGKIPALSRQAVPERVQHTGLLPGRIIDLARLRFGVARNGQHAGSE